MSNTQIGVIVLTLILMVLDIVTGVLQANVNGTFKSSMMRKGGYHKLTLVLEIVLFIILEKGKTYLGVDLPFIQGGCLYLCYMELISVVENLNKAYPNTLPKSITKWLYTAATQAGVDTEDVKDD